MGKQNFRTRRFLPIPIATSRLVPVLKLNKKGNGRKMEPKEVLSRKSEIFLGPADDSNEDCCAESPQCDCALKNLDVEYGCEQGGEG